MEMKSAFNSEDTKKLKPSDFMRARRPEQFSDSKEISTTFAPKEQFDYFLETITQRSQEKDFEVFCRSLAQKEICPNLIVQTGPTGGGDSKVDSETYPVSDEISLKWFEGIGRQASSERWAFAMSAKKDWKTKVKGDVRSIASTGRDYAHIYFMSNQAISDKKRAETEDSLAKEYGISVHILDKLWIIEKVYENNRFDIVSSVLNFTFPESKSLINGPNDLAKLADLETVENSINDFDSAINSGYQFVEDCLYAAILSRELEKSKIEVFGRFDRAKRAAKELGSNVQLRKVIYQYAWTVYWWYDDVSCFNELYDELENLSKNSNNIWDLERLGILLTAIQTAVFHQHLSVGESKIDTRLNSLTSRLIEIASDDSRPNAALTARSNLVLLKLNQTIRAEESLSPVFEEMREILESSEGLIDVPLEQLIKIIVELSEFVDEVEGFDALFESVIKIQDKRVSNGGKGRLLIKNGYRKIRSKKYYEAIKIFGRATKLLFQYEDRHDFIMAQVGIAHSYEETGLLWAARGCYAIAINQICKDFSEDGVMPLIASDLFKYLMWIEVKLGRVPYTLNWLQHKNLIESKILEIEIDEKSEQENQLFDLVLGILILKTKYEDLTHLPSLPALLELFGLDLSRFASLYVLGYEDVIRLEYETGDSNLFEFCNLWLNQPANIELPAYSNWNIGRRTSIVSNVIGTKFTIDLPNEKDILSMAEGIMAAIECFLATALEHKIFPRQPQVQCVINVLSNLHELKFEDVEDEYGDITINLFVPSTEILQIVQGYENHKKIIEAVIRLVSEGIMNFNKPEAEKLIGEDLAFDRMSHLIQFPMIINNIIGTDQCHTFTYWEKLSATERFILLRDRPWSDDLYHSKSIFEDTASSNTSFIPASLSEIKHGNHKFISIINTRVWERARWSGVLFGCFPGNPSRPILGLCFENMEEALKIFKGWLRSFGSEDSNDSINVSIVTGIDKSNPSHYKVLVCQSFDSPSRNDYTFHMFNGQVHQMTPETTANLDNFKDFLHLDVGYYLVPATYSSTSLQLDIGDERYWIKKSKVHIIEAWKVDENDVEAIVITSDLNPIIPNGVHDVPVFRTLKLRTLESK
jgi:tetratricopeptide (TPR) repeat protein